MGIATTDSPGRLLAQLRKFGWNDGKTINPFGRPVNCLERIKIADTLLRNEQWILSSFKGDDNKAEEMLESKYFPDLCRHRRIGELIGIYHECPESQEWEDKEWQFVRLDGLIENRRREQDYERWVKEHPPSARIRTVITSSTIRRSKRVAKKRQTRTRPRS
jgi:hypothetical protein